MGAKGKDGKKGAKGSKKKADDIVAPVTPEQENYSLLTDFTFLQQHLGTCYVVTETEIANRERAAENEIRAKVIILDQALEDEKKRTWDIICDMTRQYKSMKQEKDERIAKLTQMIEVNKTSLEAKQQQLEGILRDKNAILSEREEEIIELKKKIEDMSQEFAAMLKNTLEQMTEKIELVNKNWEDEMETPMMKKLEDYPAHS
jgi:DNA anti-recombination protein RmuC